MNKEAACMAAFLWGGVSGGVVFYLLSVLGYASLIVDL